MWLRLLAERRFREGEKRPSEYLVMLPQSGSWAFGVKTLMGVSHSSKIGRANPVPILYSERPPAFDCVSSCVRTCLVPRSVVPRPAFAKKYRDWNEKDASACWHLRFREDTDEGAAPQHRYPIWSKTRRDFSGFWTPWGKGAQQANEGRKGKRGEGEGAEKQLGKQSGRKKLLRHCLGVVE